MAEPKQLKTKFTGLTLKQFTRKDDSLEANFSSNLTAEVIKQMGWTGTMIVFHSPTPPKQEDLDGIKADPDAQADILAN